MLCKCSGKYIDIYFNLKITFYALVSLICGGKTLKPPNKLAGPAGKEGVLGGVYRLRNAGKTIKNITEPVTK